MRIKKLSLVAVVMSAILIACVSLAYAYYTKSVSLKENTFEVSGGDISLRIPAAFEDYTVNLDDDGTGSSDENYYTSDTGNLAIDIELHNASADNYIGDFLLFIKYQGDMSVSLRAKIQFIWSYKSGGVTYYPRMDSSEIFSYAAEDFYRISENENTSSPSTLYYFGDNTGGNWDFEITGDSFNGSFKRVIDGLTPTADGQELYPKNYKLSIVLSVQAIQYNRAELVWGSLPA